LEAVRNPHDRFFKETFSRAEVALDFVRNYVPQEIAGLVVPESFKLSKDTFVDEELEERFCDLLYEADLKGKGKIFIYFLFEHKSFQDPEVALYLLLLMVRIWLKERKQGNKALLPPILPMVVYHGEKEWKASPRFQDLVGLPDVMGRYVPGFEYLIWDLSRYTAEEVKGGVLLRVAALLMKHIHSENIGKLLPGILGLLQELKDSRTTLQFLRATLRYLSSGSSYMSREELIDALKELSMDEGGDVMATLAQQWIEEGIEKGATKLFVRLIARRFQVKPDSVYSMLVGLKTEEIEELGERFLDAKSLDEVRGWAEEKRMASAQ